MENASKALLIAGSVLIAILLIAIGVRVLNSTQGTTDATESTMQTTATTMFNNKFITYTGRNKGFVDVSSIQQIIIANNATTPGHKVDFYVGTTNYLNRSISDLNTSKKYEIIPSYNKTTGYIVQITVKPQS